MYVAQKHAGMIFIRWLALLVLSIIVFLVSACAPQPADCAHEDVFCVGMVTAFGGIEDHSLNLSAWETLQNIETQLQITRLDMIESVDTRDWQKNIIFFAENGYDVIVTVGRELGNDTLSVASQYPHILFVGLDQQLEEEYPNIATIHFPEEQAGYIAGMLAAMVTETNKVGAVCETSEIEAVWRFCEGFRTGATHEKDDVQVIVTYRDNGSFDSTFNDPDWGEQKALAQIDKGVDVMSGFGGKTLEGALLAASEKRILIIGVEDDLYTRLPDTQPVLITSIINDPSEKLSQIVSLAHQGGKDTGSYEGQIKLAPFRLPQYETASEIRLELENALQEIRSGDIEIELPDHR